LYGLFKYVTVSTSPNTSRPFLFDISGRAKWDAWNDISKRFATDGIEAAEQRYMNIAKFLGWEKNKKATDEAGKTDEDATKVEKGGGGGMGVAVSAMKAPEFNGEDIHSLAISGNVQKMARLLESGDPQVDVNGRDEYVSDMLGSWGFV
jgi:acyl-CoA-binding protein